MITVKSPNQLNIFDPWDHITPKRRKMLDNSWPGLFREHILPSIPVHKVAKYFDETFGRPTKELYAMIGALVLQQTLDLTDEETVRQYAFDTQWHYALNITEESDKAKYISLRTLWNNRISLHKAILKMTFSRPAQTGWRKSLTSIPINSGLILSTSNPICGAWVESASFQKRFTSF